MIVNNPDYQIAIMIILLVVFLKLGLTFEQYLENSDVSRNLTDQIIVSEIKVNFAELYKRRQAQINSLEELNKALQTKPQFLYNRKCMFQI